MQRVREDLGGGAEPEAAEPEAAATATGDDRAAEKSKAGWVAALDPQLGRTYDNHQSTRIPTRTLPDGADVEAAQAAQA